MPIRGVLLNNLIPPFPNGTCDPIFTKRIEWMVAHKMNMALLEPIEDPYDSRAHPWFWQWQQYVSQRHMLMGIQMPCGAGAVPGMPETAEGIWAKDVPFTVSADGQSIVASETLLPLENGGFEDGTDHWTLLSGMPSSTLPASGWSLDSTVSHSGKNSMRLHVPSLGGNYSARLLSEHIPIQANRTYQLSVWSLLNISAGERPWAWIVQLDTIGAEIKHLPVGATLYQSTKFVESTATFVADAEAVAFAVYIGAANQLGGTTLWIDDIMLIALDAALSNVIRTSITDVRVRDGTDPTKHFTLGQDFVLSNGSTPLQTRPAFRDPKNTSQLDATMLTTIHPASGGKLKPSQALLVD